LWHRHPACAIDSGTGIPPVQLIVVEKILLLT
jgi:hypothetical protein